MAGEHITVDGKSLRGSRASGKATVHLVSAFASQARFVLGHRAVADKSNEITAIPELLSLLELQGATISIDAMGCQKEIAAQIVEQKADYVLALKDNHPTLADDVQLWLDTEEAAGRLVFEDTYDKGHGRIEHRRYALSAEIDWLSQKAEWAGLTAVGMVESIRITGEKTEKERRYYLCSFNELSRFAAVVRRHWAIENEQHWVLDVQFNEDANRSRINHSAKNLATLRRMALNVIRHNNPQTKRSLRVRQQMAAWSDDYRLKLLLGKQKT